MNILTQSTTQSKVLYLTKRGERVDFTKLDWAGFIHSALDDSNLTDLEFRVFCRVLRRSGRSGECFEDATEIAKALGRKSRKPIERALKTLHKEFRMIKSLGKKGRSNRWKPTPPSTWVRKCQNMGTHVPVNGYKSAQDMGTQIPTKLIPEVNPEVNQSSTDLTDSFSNKTRVSDNKPPQAATTEATTSEPISSGVAQRHNYVRVTRASLVEKYGERAVAKHEAKIPASSSSPWKYLETCLVTAETPVLADLDPRERFMREHIGTEVWEETIENLAESGITEAMAEEALARTMRLQAGRLGDGDYSLDVRLAFKEILSLVRRQCVGCQEIIGGPSMRYGDKVYCMDCDPNKRKAV